jgi:hypothetical protein
MSGFASKVRNAASHSHAALSRWSRTEDLSETVSRFLGAAVNTTPRFSHFSESKALKRFTILFRLRITGLKPGVN